MPTISALGVYSELGLNHLDFRHAIATGVIQLGMYAQCSSLIFMAWVPYKCTFLHGIIIFESTKLYLDLKSFLIENIGYLLQSAHLKLKRSGYLSAF